jgi:hypothetical protein
VFAVLGAAFTAVLVLAPTIVEAQPRPGSYRAGPEATGNNTYIGRLEAPGRRIRSGVDVLVSGWFVDTTASGWAGADRGEIWLGSKGQGTKLGDLSVGQPRADVSDALGVTDWRNSGYSGRVPASTISGLPGGDQTLNVYLHTPSKGWWFRGSTVNIPSASDLQFPNDPVVFFVQPQEGQVVDQFAQSNSRFSLRGVALDRNDVVDTKGNVIVNQATNQPGTLGAENIGIDRVQVYLDGPRGTGSLVGNASLAGGIGVNNRTSPSSSKAPGQCCAGTGGSITDAPDFSYLGLGFGQRFALASFSQGWNPTTVAEGKHSAWAYARSSVTGKENVATVSFEVRKIRCNATGGGVGSGC